MKNLNMISRRSFLKAALAASAVSAMALTGCGGAASSTASSAAVSSSAAASGSTAAAGETFKVGIVNYVDHASLNQIVESVESRLDAIGKEKGVTFDYADYYANAQADQSNLNQIGADLVADGDLVQVGRDRSRGHPHRRYHAGCRGGHRHPGGLFRCDRSRCRRL